MNDDTALREQLLEAEMRREMGEISRRGVRGDRGRPAGPHPRDQGTARRRVGSAGDGRAADRDHRRQHVPDRSQRLGRFLRARRRAAYHRHRHQARTAASRSPSSTWSRAGDAASRTGRHPGGANGPNDARQRPERPNDPNDPNDLDREFAHLRLLPGAVRQAPFAARRSGGHARRTRRSRPRSPGSRPARRRRRPRLADRQHGARARLRRGGARGGLQHLDWVGRARWRTRRWSSISSRRPPCSRCSCSRCSQRRARPRARRARQAAHRRRF